MFNQLTPAEVVLAIGVTAQAAARSEGPGSEFERDQLMSTYSATRHLAVELSSYEPELRHFSRSVAQSVRGAQIEGQHEQLIEIASRLDDQSDGATVGATVSELLELLPGDSVQADALRAEVHAALRALADREVTLVADALESRTPRTS
jgi:hypothetical protein